MSWIRVLSPTIVVFVGFAVGAAEPERRVLLDDERWLAVENSYPPGSESPLHTHRWPRTVYVLEEGTIELVGADGAPRRVTAAAGQIMARPPETHIVRNPGTTTIRVLEIEAKTRIGLPSYAFTGGRWFDGERFVDRRLYSVDGLFTDQTPPVVDEIVDLAGAFVVPPFGDAHNHPALPERGIARLEPGYEASFVALRADPLEDSHAVKDIVYRFKQGRPIEPAEPAEASE